jgi:UDP-2,3-diacylglucosamine hydrolase
VTSVLGTAIVPLQVAAPTALLVSDLHLPGDGGPGVATLGAVVDAAVASGAALCVLGDLFDSYVCRGQVRHGAAAAVVERFRAATSRGVQITVLHGNRDFLLGDEFARASGARVVAGGVRAVLGGVDTLLLHGDELCQNDLPYQRAKRWLRQPLLKAVVRRLPLRAALALGGRARRQSQMVTSSGDTRRFLPTAAAVDAAFATGARRLVFGHIHRFAHGLHGPAGDREYWVLPAFDAAATGLLLAGGGATPVRFAAGAPPVPLPEPPPPPCPFA